MKHDGVEVKIVAGIHKGRRGILTGMFWGAGVAAAKGIELYIVVSANAYELAAGENCFDVIGGKYVRFGGYDEYRKFVLKSRKEKDKRYEER